MSIIFGVRTYSAQEMERKRKAFQRRKQRLAGIVLPPRIPRRPRRLQYDKRYIRLGTLSVQDVLPFIGTDLNFSGVTFHLKSIRLKNFKEHGISCKQCGITGEYFAIEKHRKRNSKERTQYAKWHLNLYGKNDQDHEIMLTHDHIMPRSLGGKNSLKNAQTLCDRCNWKKGNKILI